MKILLVGDGARENMLAEQLARSSELYVAMEKRNPGIEKASQKFFVCDYSNMEAIGGWAIRENIDIALITSESGLIKGLPDALSEAGLRVVSPPGEGTVIGENTLYAHNIIKEAGIRTPRFISCKDEREISSAMKEIPRMVLKPAVKVDWKGTRFSEADLKRSAEGLKYGKKLIKSHGSVIVEELVEGEGFSLQGITDGKSLSVMPPVHIVKRALEGNQGELTEGMGGFSSGRLLPFMKQADLDYARESLWKVVGSLKSKGVDYRGPIRGEFMVTREGTVMLDIYATMGDIDTLNNFLLLRTQLSEVLTSVAEGSLMQLSFWEKATVVKYLVPTGYPGKARKSRIEIDERALWNNGAKAAFGSVEVKDGQVWTAKSRALAVCTSGNALAEAEAKAEGAAQSVKGDLYHRRDIASPEYVNRAMKHVALLRSSKPWF